MEPKLRALIFAAIAKAKYKGSKVRKPCQTASTVTTLEVGNDIA